ncbi:TetR/AcrR family transcriptional regulator [Arthrobacter sp. CJ23]|uniref:TetR/AcrR family transcriptional regulator n=1 Tax=Arthrobacter sp. CJ23 TaxID=2972479 RepID=UPI00215C3DB6|nr:TetR/AcrR family transcriptional regulator [Arthrobacter sp. CJ23]UVJ41014.1 TetR/AcrR family transcriptional regulator [Arthrobacter sp. CJ23]
MTDDGSTVSATTGRPGRPRTFTAGQVAAAALGVLDASGPEGLSVRAVAAALGINPNALYTYVRSRADLERLLVEEILGGVDPGLLVPGSGTWQQQLQDFANALRGAIHAHPGVAGLFMTAPMDGPVAIEVGEGLLRVLAGAGLSAEGAARASYALMVFVLGSVAMEVAETDGRAPMDPEAERMASRLEAFRGIDERRLPLSAAAVGTMATWVGAEQFRWGLKMLIAGLEASTLDLS